MVKSEGCADTMRVPKVALLSAEKYDSIVADVGVAVFCGGGREKRRTKTGDYRSHNWCESRANPAYVGVRYLHHRE